MVFGWLWRRRAGRAHARVVDDSPESSSATASVLLLLWGHTVMAKRFCRRENSALRPLRCGVGGAAGVCGVRAGDPGEPGAPLIPSLLFSWRPFFSFLLVLWLRNDRREQSAQQQQKAMVVFCPYCGNVLLVEHAATMRYYCPTCPYGLRRSYRTCFFFCCWR